MTIRDLARTQDRAALAAILCRPLPPRRRRFWRRVRVLALGVGATAVGAAALASLVVVARVVL